MRPVVRFKSAVNSFLLCIIFFLVAVPGASVKFNSGFTGVVVEQTGAAVVGARVTATNQATHISQFSISTESGDFRISTLPGGVYTIEVEATGFKHWVQKDVQLESNEVKTLHPSLALPTQTTTVEVSGAVTAVETDRSDTSREISETTIENAPLLGRNIYTSMIELAPGFTCSVLPVGAALGAGCTQHCNHQRD